MALTLLPKSPRTTIALVVVLVGASIFVMTGAGSKHRRHGAASAPRTPVSAATQAAQAFVDLAVPGPNAAGSPGAAGGAADTAFADSPFLSLDDEALGGNGFAQNGGGSAEAADGGFSGSPDAATLPGPRRLQGTIIGQGRDLALIDGRYVGAGQFVAGWKVSFVGPREARLEKDGRTLTLKVGRDQ